MSKYLKVTHPYIVEEVGFILRILRNLTAYSFQRFQSRIYPSENRLLSFGKLKRYSLMCPGEGNSHPAFNFGIGFFYYV